MRKVVILCFFLMYYGTALANQEAPVLDDEAVASYMASKSFQSALEVLTKMSGMEGSGAHAKITDRDIKQYNFAAESLIKFYYALFERDVSSKLPEVQGYKPNDEDLLLNRLKIKECLNAIRESPDSLVLARLVLNVDSYVKVNGDSYAKLIDDKSNASRANGMISYADSLASFDKMTYESKLKKVLAMLEVLRDDGNIFQDLFDLLHISDKPSESIIEMVYKVITKAMYNVKEEEEEELLRKTSNTVCLYMSLPIYFSRRVASAGK